jgi:tetratricopeptide (TPR) repeat protein
MRIYPVTALLAAALSLAPLAVSWANGAGAMPSSGSMNSASSMRRSPEEMAKSAYNSGVRSIKDAKGYEDDAAKADKEEKRSKYLDKAQKAYTKALEQFTDAVQQQPGMYQAWNYIGFASRHLGHYQDALGAYAKALELKPGDPDAIEYRGEAYLGLNQLDEAKGAYMTLFDSARPLSDQLLSAMQRWFAARRTEAKESEGADLEAFGKWLQERDQIAKQTASLAVGSVPSAWSK